MLMIILPSIAILKMHQNLTLEVFNNARKSVKALDGFKEEIDRRLSLVAKVPDMTMKGDKGLFVVVIGESHTRDRMSAYDYYRDTTPWLRSQRENENFVFLENAYSNYPNTTFSLIQALTAKSQYDSYKFETSHSVLEILNAAGFETWWISVQKQIGVWDTPIGVIANFAREKRWLSGRIDKVNSGEVFDGLLVDEISKIPVSNKKRIVFLHTLGAHADYRRRYPSNFERWMISDENDIILNRENAYNNALFYSDYVWKSIYQILSKRSDFRALLVTSDHGEDVAQAMHTPDMQRFTWSMVRIPTWIYFSESYKRDYPDRVEALKSNAAKGWTNDMLYDALLGMTGVTDHSFYQQKNDIFSFDFDRPLEKLLTIHGALFVKDDPCGLRGANASLRDN